MDRNIVTPFPLKLQISDIRNEFVDLLNDVNQEIVLDRIDQLDSVSGFRIQSHDALGALPDIYLRNTGNRYEVLDQLDREIVNLLASRGARRSSKATVPLRILSSLR